LKQAGLMKKISSSGQWKLLGIGQEIAIHSILTKSNLFLKDLPPYGLAVKVSLVQRHLLNHAPTIEWSVVFRQVLHVAMKYREEHKFMIYEVLTDPKHLWMHEIQECLLLQLKHPAMTKVETLETIAAASLQGHQETKLKNYDLVKSLAIQIVRSQLKNDELAFLFNLSLEHAYYEGLYQLSIDKPLEYSLEPIFKRWSDFGFFSLRWFAQQGYEVLTYGRLLPKDFKKLVDNDFINFKWIYEHRLKKKSRG
jgi:hypothetical protein